jgi:hypothetical protein
MANFKQSNLTNIKSALKTIYSDEPSEEGYFDSPDNPETKAKVKSEIIVNFPPKYKKTERAQALMDLAIKLRKLKINAVYNNDSTAKKKSSAGIIIFGDSNYFIVGKIMEILMKPSNIKPSIVNGWLTPEQIVDNVIQYLVDQEVEGQIRTRIEKLLKLTVADTNHSIEFDAPKNIVPAEFYEILTAIKLGVLLRANDKKIFETLGIPKKMNLSQSRIKIYIPQAANYPLLDYFLSITTKDQNEEDALKISVKSKVKSPATNTVKFSDIFKSERAVDDWHKSLPNIEKSKQKGQRIIAESAIEVYKGPKYNRKVQPGVPINAVLNLLVDSSESPKIKSLIKSKMSLNQKELDFFTKGLNTVRNNIGQFKTKDDLLETVVKNKSEITTFQKIIGENRKTAGQPASPTLINLGIICEKILQYSSKKLSSTEYNFYQIFFDEVLRKKELAYAITSVKGNRLEYKFYSKINFAQEYTNWIELRSKATDVIGLSV